MAGLSSAAHKEIEATIADIEQRTAAELVVMEVGRSAGYAEIKLGYALAATLAVSGITQLFATRDRTWVLIMLSLLERRVVILGDAGIHAKIQPAGWQSHVDHIVKAIHDGKAGQGVCETLRAIGETLTAEFPPRPDDVDELSNAVRRADR